VGEEVSCEREEVSCEREAGNPHDSQAVAMTKLIDGNVEVVGHVPRTISSICSIFIRRGGSIVCKVTGSREYSSDLEQGGLQLPCELTFRIADLVIRIPKDETIFQDCVCGNT